MVLDAKFREFAAKYPRPSAHPAGGTPNGDASWDQDCGVFVYRFGQYVIGATAWVKANRVYGPTAWDVALASGALNPHAERCPQGGIHWWKSNTRTGKPGHVAVDLDGGGTRTAMATYSVLSALAPALGYQSVAGYSRAKPAMTYVGWTDNYAGAQFPLTTPAGTGTTPFPSRRRRSMATLFKHQDKSLWALAGDSPGTPANWLETGGQDFANQLAAQHGTAAIVSAGTWDSWKQAYLAPLNTVGGGGFAIEIDYARLATTIAGAVPTRVVLPGVEGTLA